MKSLNVTGCPVDKRSFDALDSDVPFVPNGYVMGIDTTLIKAWVPAPLHRAVKTEASRRGMTIQEFVIVLLRDNPKIRKDEKSHTNETDKR